MLSGGGHTGGAGNGRPIASGDDISGMVSGNHLLLDSDTFFIYITQPLIISAILMQIAVLPVGKFMAATLPTRKYRLMGRSFTLNPGPFNMKEHVIITVFANCGVSPGGGDGYSIGAITVMRGYYKQSVNFVCALLIVLTTQILGYGWAGMLRRYLVDPVEMWWPQNLAQVSLFRVLHEKETKSKGLTRMKIFLVFLAGSFVYYTFPGYLFPVLSFFSWVCWAWPHSITAQQIGSGDDGLGLGAFCLDWAGICAYHGNPLVSPWTSTLNVGIGFVMFIYIIVPLCYRKFDTFDSQKFPIFSKDLFTASGHKYNITQILTPKFDLNVAAYEKYSKPSVCPINWIRVLKIYSNPHACRTISWQGYLDAEQICSEECQTGHPCKIDEKVQRGAPVVVPYLINREHRLVPPNVFCVER